MVLISYRIIAQIPTIKSSLFPHVFGDTGLFCPSNLFSFCLKNVSEVCPFLLSLSLLFAPTLPLLFRDLLRDKSEVNYLRKYYLNPTDTFKDSLICLPRTL